MDNCGAIGKRGEKEKRKVRKEFAINFVRCQAETDGNEPSRVDLSIYIYILPKSMGSHFQLTLNGVWSTASHCSRRSLGEFFVSYSNKMCNISPIGYGMCS